MSTPNQPLEKLSETLEACTQILKKLKAKPLGRKCEATLDNPTPATQKEIHTCFDSLNCKSTQTTNFGFQDKVQGTFGPTNSKPNPSLFSGIPSDRRSVIGLQGNQSTSGTQTPSIFAGINNTGFGLPGNQGISSVQSSTQTPSIFNGIQPARESIFGNSNSIASTGFGVGFGVNPSNIGANVLQPVSQTVKFTPARGSDVLMKSGAQHNIITRHQVSFSKKLCIYFLCFLK